MNALPTFTVPLAGEVLAGRAFSLPPPIANIGSPGDVLADRSRSYLPRLAALYDPTSYSAPTYVQNRLLGRGSSSGTGIAEVLTLGTNLTLSGTTLNAESTGGSGGGGLDPNSSVYPPFMVGANDDEFSDGSFSGWTAVNDGANVPTVTETNHVASVLVPGGHAAADLAAYLKAVTPSTGDYIQMAVRGVGFGQNFNICGLIFADGTTYGAGTQVYFYYSPQENQVRMARGTNFSSSAAQTGATIQISAPFSDLFLRFQYTAANSWTGSISPDGVSWATMLGPTSHTLTPTQIGFFFSSWGGANPFVWSLRYFRHHT